jgi:hypothetical protein
MKRQRQLEEEIATLTKEQVTTGFKILKLVLDYPEVQKLHQLR